MPLPNDVLEAIERLGSQSNGDVPALVIAARSAANVDDASLARGIEDAAVRRARAGDRGGAWWLACAVATLRASPISSAQEDAELVAARVLGELVRSPAALSPLPQGARWIVAGQGEPRPAAETIELARRNASTYIERLDAELAGREPLLRSKAAVGAAVHAPIEEALASYIVAIASTRAALARTVDYVLARDPSHTAAGESALAELDDVVAPSLRARIDGVRRGLSAGPVEPVMMDRPSFAGAAPPAFSPGSSGVSAPVPSAPVPSAPVASVPPDATRPSIEHLDAAMRAAFERAWAAPEAANLAAFEQSVRARYEHETASIPDPEARQKALDHYVAHAMAQLPQK